MVGETRILIVDQDETERDELRYLLEGEGYEVDQAACEQDALYKIEREPFDLIIAEVPLPDGAAAEVMRHIREADTDIVEIVIGDHLPAEAAIEAWRSEVSAYIPRPLDDPEGVVAAVEGGLAGRRSHSA